MTLLNSLLSPSLGDGILQINTQTSHYTLKLTDIGKLIQMNSSLPVILTVPENSEVAFPIGTTIDIIQAGIGKVSIADNSSVIIYSTNGFDTRTQYSKVTLIKNDLNTWYLSGDTAVSGFKTEWETTTPSETITLPLYNSGVFNATVDWGDGSTSSITTYDDVDIVHTYATAGRYVVNITGDCPSWSFNNSGDILKIKNIISWGDSTLFNGFAYLTNGFYGCTNLKSLGNDKILPSGTSLTNLQNTFRGCTSLKSICCIFEKLVSLAANGFNATFRDCTSLTSIPVDLFRYNTAVSTSGFFEIFLGCSSLASIPVDLFRYNTAVSTTGFASTFYGCTSLTSIPVDLFRYNTAVSTSGFNATFNDCTLLTSIPTDLFRYNTAVSTNGFVNTFKGCASLTSIPVDLFRYNTLVTSFSYCFSYCYNLSTLPADLFRYNTEVTDFSTCFYQSGLTSFQADLFRYNTKVITFNACFGNCPNLQLRSDIFYAAGEQATRFLNKSVNFTRCFQRTTFTGTQGTAPDLWNCNFGTGTATKTDCFDGAGNSLTSISNYASIPVDWL